MITKEARQRRNQEEQLLVPEMQPVALLRALRHILETPEGASVLEHATKTMRRYRTCWPTDKPGGRVCRHPNEDTKNG